MGAQAFFKDSRALHIEQADLAVAALANHLTAGGAVARVAGQGAGVGAARGAGLRAALLTHLALQGGSGGGVIGRIRIDFSFHFDTHNNRNMKSATIYKQAKHTTVLYTIKAASSI